ncbi:uncharacterized protein V1518DRAFT_6101 [Limtongia smithiae]|uniref:uncharacterized protein n=1 Tax=Limtongia smithiae TaxID=1125753 RepID=UPI0034CF4451
MPSTASSMLLLIAAAAAADALLRGNRCDAYSYDPTHDNFDADFDSDEDDPEPPLHLDPFTLALNLDADIGKTWYYRRLFQQLNTRIDPSFVPEHPHTSPVLRTIEAHSQKKLNTDLTKQTWANLRRYFPPPTEHGQQHLSLLDLPTEILDIIINVHATNRVLGEGWRKTYKVLGSVCGKFCQLAQASRFQNLSLKTLEECVQLLDFLRNSPRLRFYIRRVKVDFTCNTAKQMNDYCVSLDEILRLCPSLVEMSSNLERAVFPVADPVFTYQRDKYPNVRTLTVSDKGSSIGIPVMTPVLDFVCLTRLKFFKTNLSTVQLQLSSKQQPEMAFVRELTLDEVILDHSTMTELSSMFPKLEILNARHALYDIMTFISLLLVRPKSKLRALTITGCVRRRIGDTRTNISLLGPIPRRLWTDLEEICIYDSTPLSADYLPPADIMSLPKLKHLHIRFLVHPIGLCKLNEFFSALRNLQAILTPPKKLLDDPELIEDAPVVTIECPVDQDIGVPLGTRSVHMLSWLQLAVPSYKFMWTSEADRLVKIIDPEDLLTEGAEYLRVLHDKLVMGR